uniref:F-box domain-containing protein n=1 Tax=Angiostrongylus cantonensis TaxID=6313 RepID=A0A158P7U4_ANGCA
MRVYNPRATFEQAQLIAELFEKGENTDTENCNESGSDTIVGGLVKDQTCNILSLPDDILLKIFGYVFDPQTFEPHTSLKRYLFAGRSRLASKAPVWPPASYDGAIIAYIYGDSAKNNFCKCVFIDEVSSATFPGQICTFLTVEGMVITDHLMDMLYKLDLSRVEELFWHDIQGAYASNVVDKMQRLLTMMPELCYAEFCSTSFDPATMFPESNSYWNDLGLDNYSFTCIRGFGWAERDRIEEYAVGMVGMGRTLMLSYQSQVFLELM